MRRILPLLSLLFACGCSQEEQLDYGQVCIEAVDQTLVVHADSQDCAADHEGASFECSISVDGMKVTVGTVFMDGKDPNDACFGPLETTCEATVEAGSYTIEFAGEQAQIDVPAGTRVCLPGGADETGG